MMAYTKNILVGLRASATTTLKLGDVVNSKTCLYDLCAMYLNIILDYIHFGSHDTCTFEHPNNNVLNDENILYFIK